MATLRIIQSGETKTLTVSTGVGAQGAPGAQGPPGSDATVTTEAIETALGYTPADAATNTGTNTGDQDLSGLATQSALAAFAEDVVNDLAAETAAREAIEAEARYASPYDAGDHFLPFKKTRAYNSTNYQSNHNPPLVIASMGDSLGVHYLSGNRKYNLVKNLSFRGVKMFRPDELVTISGTAAVGYWSGSGINWTGGQIVKMSPSTTIQYTVPDAGDGDMVCNRIGVGYFREGTSGSCTFSLQYSRDGGTVWSTAATIDASAGANKFNYYTYNFSGFNTPIRVRVVTGSGQTVHLVGAGMWYGGDTQGSNDFGYITADMSWGGIVVGQSATDYEEIFAELEPKIALISCNEITGYGVGESFDVMRTEANAGNSCDFVMISSQPGGVDTSLNDTEANYIAQRENMRAWVERHDENFIDLHHAWKSWNDSIRRGWATDADSVHPGGADGYEARQQFVSELLARGLYFYASSLPFGWDVRQFGNMEVDYNDNLRIRSANGSFTFDGGAKTVLNRTNREWPDSHGNLWETWSGKPGTAQTWTFACREGTANYNTKEFLKFTTSGSFSSGTITERSDWKMVKERRLLTSDPSGNPPSGSVLEYPFLNGSSKVELRIKKSDGTVLTVYTEP